MAKLKLDLHDIYNRGGKIDSELNRIIQEAIDRKIKLVEIIPGKGSGQLKKKVLRFLNQSHIRKQYHRIEKDSKKIRRTLGVSSCILGFKGSTRRLGFYSGDQNKLRPAQAMDDGTWLCIVWQYRRDGGPAPVGRPYWVGGARSWTQI